MLGGAKSIEVGRDGTSEWRKVVVCGIEPLDASLTTADVSFEVKWLFDREGSVCVMAGDVSEAFLECIVAFWNDTDNFLSLPILTAVLPQGCVFAAGRQEQEGYRRGFSRAANAPRCSLEKDERFKRTYAFRI